MVHVVYFHYCRKLAVLVTVHQLMKLNCLIIYSLCIEPTIRLLKRYLPKAHLCVTGVCFWSTAGPLNKPLPRCSPVLLKFPSVCVVFMVERSWHLRRALFTQSPLVCGHTSQSIGLILLIWQQSNLTACKFKYTTTTWAKLSKPH